MKQNNNQIKNCEICESYATTLCYQCISYFCDSCYKFVHDKKNNSNHIKEPLDPYVPIDTKCPEHSKSPVNLFCVDEKGKTIYVNYMLIFIFKHRTLLLLLLI